MTSTKIHCECCNKDYVKSYFKKHLLSKKHLKNQAASGIVQPIVVLPPQDVSNKKHCECCNKYLSKSYFKKHLKTKKHLKNQTIFNEQQDEQMADEILTLPKDLMNIIIGYKNEMEEHEQIHNIIESVNEQLVKKIERKSNKVYSREIKLDKPTEVTIIKNILSANFNNDLYINYYNRAYGDIDFLEERIINKLSFQYNPMVNCPHSRLMILFC